MNVNELLAKVYSSHASDLVLKVKSPPLIRVNGELVRVGETLLGPEDIVLMAKTLTTEEEWPRFDREMELDLAYTAEGVARFRINMFKQRGSISIVCRIIASEVPTIESLGLPPIVADLAMRPRGLVLVTGSAASGKSTTQAAIIDHRNANEECHVMTIEDPVEFIHSDKKGLVNQRQVGRDTQSFANGLKYVLRQDPDVILIGEMRDLETIGMAITAAETGHLAIGTLHTTNSAQTIDRVINAFPSHQQQQIRMQLSINLIAVISQVLCCRADGQGLVAGFEVLLATPAIRNVIRENKTFQISQLLQMGTKEGMISLERSLVDMVKQGTVTVDEAFAKSSRPEELANLLGPQAAPAAAGIF
ncbi:MAG: type IV pilus twitching motility protein PilT [Actinomycetota bacterium]|nr:type IV pilus twitching motility protein PilT [Actinomycetota bacterium]